MKGTVVGNVRSAGDPSPAGRARFPAHGVRRWQAACLGSAVTALALTAAVLEWGVLGAETTVRDLALAWASPAVVDVARSVNEAGTWRVLLPATLGLFAACGSARERWWLWAAVLIAAPLLGEAWQEVVARPRPRSPALGFPSGHATSVASFAVVVTYLVHRAPLSRVTRVTIQALAVFTALAVGLARIVLQAHWAADVATGFALGSTCASGAAWWDATHPAPSRPELAPDPVA